MDYFWQLNISCSVYILVCVGVLIHFVQINDSATIDDLKVACGIKYKPVQDINLNTVPDECTSVLLNSKDFPDENAFNTMMSSPRKVPVLLIVDDIPYDSWLTRFNNKVSQDVQLFIDLINKYDLDGLIFDNLYPDQKLNVTTETNSVITVGLPVFLTAIKTAYYTTQDKIIFLGIVIPTNPNIILYGFSYYYLDQLIDAYVLYNATNYFGKCTVFEGPLSPTYKVEEVVKALYSVNAFYMNKQKVIFESQLYVKDFTNNQELSYGETCYLCPGTKVCRDSLKSVYQKARLMNVYQLKGTYVRYCNQDDVYGLCYCGDNATFPGVKAIAAAIRGTEAVFVECASYGVPGVYRPDGVCGYPSNAAGFPGPLSFSARPPASSSGFTPDPNTIRPSF